MNFDFFFYRFQNHESAASILRNPFAYIWKLLTWLFARTLMFVSEIHNLPMILAQEEMMAEEEPDFKKPPKMHKIRYNRPCDMKMTLYIVNETNFDRNYTNEPDDCALPFYAQRVSIYQR